MNSTPKTAKILVLLVSVALAAACVAYAAHRNSSADAAPANGAAEGKPIPPAAPTVNQQKASEEPAMQHAPAPPPEPKAPPEEDVYLGGSKSMPMPRQFGPGK